MGTEPSLVGRVLAGRFRVERQLGQGGMGTVYEAVQLGLERRLALKVLAPELGEDPRYVERFRREAEAVARLMHPNVVQVADFVQAPGEPVLIVMELLLGSPLLDRIKAGPLPIAQAVGIATQLASALGAAHAAGIVHRDLKPANVFLVPLADGGELVKLLDFGIAKLAESDGYRRLTQTGILIGTPRYASPEQVMGARDVDLRSDVFSLGVLLYGMLTARPPFTKKGAELLVEIQDREPADPRTVRPELPEGLVAVVQRAMQKRREARFQSMTELASALAPFLAWPATPSQPGLLVAPPLSPSAPAWSTSAGAPLSASQEPTANARPAGALRGAPASPIEPTGPATRIASFDPTSAPAARSSTPTPPPGAAPASGWAPRSFPPGSFPPGSFPPGSFPPGEISYRTAGSGHGAAPRTPPWIWIVSVAALGALALVALGVVAAVALRLEGRASAAHDARAPGSTASSSGGPGDFFQMSATALALGPECAEYERRACACLGRFGGDRTGCDRAREDLASAVAGLPLEQASEQCRVMALAYGISCTSGNEQVRPPPDLAETAPSYAPWAEAGALRASPHCVDYLRNACCHGENEYCARARRHMVGLYDFSEADLPRQGTFCANLAQGVVGGMGECPP